MNKSKSLLSFPATRQSTKWSCGAAALQMVLGYYGLDVREDRIRAQAGTIPKWGTPLAGMQRVLRQHGLRVNACSMTLPELKQYLRKKIPVILLLQAWTNRTNVDWAKDWSDGHYAVAIGYDTRHIIFADPASLHRTTLTFSELATRWHDVDRGKKRYDHFGLAVFGQQPRYRPGTIIHMD